MSSCEGLLNALGISALVLLDLSHTHQVLPFSMVSFDPNTLPAASTKYYHYTGLTGGNGQMEQGEMGNHNLPAPRQDIYGEPGPSVLSEPSSTAIAGTLSSQSRVRDYADATLFFCRKVEAQTATTRKLTKKERDKVNKRAQRSKDREDFEKICNLLKIPLAPRSDLVFRSKRLHFHYQVGKSKRFVVLGCVEKLVEKCSRLDSESERQCHLEENEAGAAILIEELATEGNTSFPPIDVRSFLGGSDMIGATLVNGFGPTGRELDAW